MAITRAVPGRTAIASFAALGACALVALIARAELSAVTRLTVAVSIILVSAGLVDYARSVGDWRRSRPVLRRQLPAAFAIGVKRTVSLAIESRGACTWHCAVYDHADVTLVTDGMPVRLRYWKPLPPLPTTLISNFNVKSFAFMSR